MYVVVNDTTNAVTGVVAARTLAQAQDQAETGETVYAVSDAEALLAVDTTTEYVGGAVSSVAPPAADLLSEAKALRDRILTDTDWSQATDVSPTVQAAFATYRAALRNITNDPNWPDWQNVTWPTRPSGNIGDP